MTERLNFFITDVSKYSEVSAVRNEYFANAHPATTMVEISNTVAKGCEIEVMAMIYNEKVNKDLSGFGNLCN